MIKFLIKRGDNTNFRSFDGWTLLIFASANNRIDVANFLNESCCINIDTPTKKGWTFPTLYIPH